MDDVPSKWKEQNDKMGKGCLLPACRDGGAESTESHQKHSKPETKMAEERKQQDNGHSMFFYRQFESDSRTFYDSKEILRRAFEADLKICMKRSKFVTQSYSSTVHSTLEFYYGEIRTLFRYFSASSSGDPFTMSMNEFLQIMHTCKVPDDCLGILFNGR